MFQLNVIEIFVALDFYLIWIIKDLFFKTILHISF